MANTFVKVSSKADKCYSLSQSSQMDMIAHGKLTDDYVKSVVQDSVHPDAEATQNIFDRIDSRNFYKVRTVSAFIAFV